MAAPKRTSTQIEYDRVDIARRYLKGELQATIAEALGVSRQQIGYDLERIREQWLKSTLVDFNARQAQELARVDLLEREYWIAWDRSCTQRRISQTARTTGDTIQDKASIRTEDRDGNPAFLDGVRWCIEQRCKLFGLYQPEKFALVDWRKEVEERGGNAGELFEQMVQRFSAALAPGVGEDDRGRLAGGETPSTA